ncbi:MAG: DUF305 domain-containing protein [Verrucomicrobiota bacterium]
MFLLMILHCLACFALLAGVIFLVAWAIKTMTPANLLRWSIGLLIGGAVVCLLTMIGMSHHGNVKFTRTMMDGGSMHVMQGGSMMRNDDMMMDADHMMGGMAMDDMSAALEGKTGDAFDKAFLEMMIPHHQGAIDMVKNAQTSAKHQEIKDLAKDIATAQQREIDLMHTWQHAWGYEQD